MIVSLSTADLEQIAKRDFGVKKDHTSKIGKMIDRLTGTKLSFSDSQNIFDQASKEPNSNFKLTLMQLAALRMISAGTTDQEQNIYAFNAVCKCEELKNELGKK